MGALSGALSNNRDGRRQHLMEDNLGWSALRATSVIPAVKDARWSAQRATSKVTVAKNAVATTRRERVR